MAAAHVSASTLGYGTRTNTVLSAPATITDGNCLEIYLYLANGITPTAPAGFTLVKNTRISTMGAGSDVMDIWHWRKTASGESGSYTVTHASTQSAGYIGNVSGGDSASNFEDFAATSNAVDGAGGNYTATGGTTTVNDSLVTMAFVSWDDNSPVTPPGGTTPTFTERFDDGTGVLWVGNGVMATAGATGDKTATGTAQSAFGGYIAVLTSVKATGGGGGSTQPPRTMQQVRLRAA